MKEKSFQALFFPGNALGWSLTTEGLRNTRLYASVGSLDLPQYVGALYMETSMITGCKDQIRPRSQRDNGLGHGAICADCTALLASACGAHQRLSWLRYKARYRDLTSGLHILI